MHGYTVQGHSIAVAGVSGGVAAFTRPAAAAVHFSVFFVFCFLLRFILSLFQPPSQSYFNASLHHSTSPVPRRRRVVTGAEQLINYRCVCMCVCARPAGVSVC